MEEKKNEPVSEEKKSAAPLSNQQKSALLRYMAILFAVAFLFVLGSLIIQSNSTKNALSAMSKSNSDALSNAMANAQQLQDQTRELEDENRELREQLEALQTLLDERDSAIEGLKSQLQENQDQQKNIDSQEKTLRETYEALLVAVTCQTREGNVTFSRAVEAVEKNKALLSTKALEVYESLFEAEAEQ